MAYVLTERQRLRFVPHERVFDRKAVGECVGGGGVTADPFGQLNRAVGRAALE